MLWGASHVTCVRVPQCLKSRRHPLLREVVPEEIVQIWGDLSCCTTPNQAEFDECWTIARHLFKLRPPAQVLSSFPAALGFR